MAVPGLAGDPATASLDVGCILRRATAPPLRRLGALWSVQDAPDADTGDTQPLAYLNRPQALASQLPDLISLVSGLTGTDPLLLIEADPLGAQVFVPRSSSPHGQTGRHEPR